VKQWTPFEPATLRGATVTETELQSTAKRFNLPVEEVKAAYADLANDHIFINSRYQVNVRAVPAVPGWPAMIHLSIKRLDKDRVGPERYRDFLRIKNELVGPEHEAVELYPAMSRNVDTANQYHVWVVMEEGQVFPFGFRTGHMSSDTTGTNARQHPFEDEKGKQ
jgi:hypothetical protein